MIACLKAWGKGIAIALISMLVYAIAIGAVLALTLLIISMEEGSKNLSDMTWPLTEAVILLSQGSGFQTSSLRLTLVPLLLTILLIALVASVTRRLSVSFGSYATGLLSWTAINWIFSQGTNISLLDATWLLLIKTALVFTVGFVLAALPQSYLVGKAKEIMNTRISLGLRNALRLGLSLFLILMGLFLLFGLIAVVVWTVQGYEAVDTLFDLINMQIGSRVMTSICALAWLPNLCIWAVSWLFGAGFSVGELGSFSLWIGQAHSLPPLPVFGLLPQAVHSSVMTNMLVMIPFICSFVLGLLSLLAQKILLPPLKRLMDRVDTRNLLAKMIYAAGAFCLASAMVAVFGSLCFNLSNGSLGRDRLAHVGVDLVASSQRLGRPTSLGLFCAWLLTLVLWSLIFAIGWMFKRIHGPHEQSLASSPSASDSGMPSVSAVSDLSATTAESTDCSATDDGADDERGS